MNSLLSLSISFVVVMAGLGLGRLAQRLWLAPRNAGVGFGNPATKRQSKQPSSLGSSSSSDALLLNTSLGLGILSLVILAFGLLRLYGGIGGRVMLVVILLLAMYGLSDVATWLWGGLARFSLKRIPIGVWFCAALLLIIIVATLICALAPPSGDDWDSLAYHLAVPQLYIDNGGIDYIDFCSHSNFPFLVEMLYVPGLMLGLASAAKIMHFWMGALAVIAVVRLTTRHISTKAGMLAAVAFAGIPLVMWEATTGYVDLAVALYTVLAAYGILNYIETGKRADIVLCGVACGFAASVKMLGLATIGFAAAWLMVDGVILRRKAGWMYMVPIRGAAYVVLVSALVCTPWYLKTLAYTGNPVYPFFYSIFGGRNWNAELAALYSSSQAHFGMGKSLIALLLSPYNLAVHPERFYDTAGLYVGPILLIFVPLMLFIHKTRSRQIVGVTAFTAAHILAWFCLTQQSRYLLPVFALSSALCAGLAYAGSEDLRSLRWGMWTVFVATACVGLVTMFPMLRSRLPVVMGTESERAYLSRTLDVFPAEQYMNDELPDSARVIFYGDTRGFYLKRDYVWGDWGHNQRFSGTFTSVNEYVKYLKSQGMTHAMLNLRFFPSRDKADRSAALVYQAIDSGLLERIYPEILTETRRVEVYTIR